MRKVFKAAEEDIELQDSATAPLLAGAAASPHLLRLEERDLLAVEGPNAASRGSLLDAVTNVSFEPNRSAFEMLLNGPRDMVDGQLHYRSWYNRVSREGAYGRAIADYPPLKIAVCSIPSRLCHGRVPLNCAGIYIRLDNPASHPHQ